MNIYQTVTDRIIAELDRGIIPWRKEWKCTGQAGMPYNFATKKPYRGINILLCMTSGFSDARWITYKQSQELGGQVRRGEKGTKIVFWSMFDVEKTDAAAGESSTDKVPFMREYTVFNYSQIDGLTQPLPFAENTFEPVPAAQSLCDSYLTRASIALNHGGDRAYYSPRLDAIQMPLKESFDAPDSYYSTLFHECGHSTGHARRLDRGVESHGGFGSEDYSKEELVAEFTAAFLCASVGISNERVESNHVAYIQGWLKALKNDSKLIVSAAQKAQKAADLIQDKQFNTEAAADLTAAA